MESYSYPRINYYSQQVVHGYLFAQIFGPVPLMLTLPIIQDMTYLIQLREEDLNTPTSGLWARRAANCSTPQYIQQHIAESNCSLENENLLSQSIDECALFSGDVRSRTGVYKNVNDTLLSGCIGFEVLGTSTNCHKGGRLYIRRPIDTGQNSWLNQRPLSGSKRFQAANA